MRGKKKKGMCVSGQGRIIEMLYIMLMFHIFSKNRGQ